MTAGVTGGITPVCCISEQVISVRPSPVHSTVRGDGGDLSVLGQLIIATAGCGWPAGWLSMQKVTKQSGSAFVVIELSQNLQHDTPYVCLLNRFYIQPLCSSAHCSALQNQLAPQINV